MALKDFPLNSPYPVTEEQKKFYNDCGYILVNRLANSAEINYYRIAIREAVERNKEEKRPLSERDTYGKAFLQIKNLWLENETVKKFVLAKRFGSVAAKLMGVERVCLYHDQALFKEAGGGHTPWHQDQFYWPLDTDKTITMWMPLVDLTLEMGIMQFVTGSHKQGYLIAQEISDDSDDFFVNYIRENNLEVSRYQELKAGDATFHSGWTLHNAPPNKTDSTREVMTIIYYAEGTRILKPDHDWRQKDLDAWLGGRKPGEVASSSMNPVI